MGRLKLQGPIVLVICTDWRSFTFQLQGPDGRVKLIATAETFASAAEARQAGEPTIADLSVEPRPHPVATAHDL